MCIENRVLQAASVLLLWLCLANSHAGDWPMWRFDAGRTGAAPDNLPETLHLRWRRDLPPVACAWPLEPRMQFDTCYEPVVMGTSLFVGSPVDGGITAYDTETGDVEWQTYTNGPVRFAPVAWQEKLYIASDDGYIYCLDARTGEQIWTFRAAPSERPDGRHLGNGRLVSFWPVRGAPVIADGTLFVGAGLWPVLGTFMYALHPETGTVKWCNSRLNHMVDIRTDHNRVGESSLCPQGYLVHAGGRLLVPNGRAMPVGLDPATGDLAYYVQGYRNGHCRVTAHGKHVFVGASGVLDIRTGREMGERWHEGHPETPREYSTRTDLFETPYVPYKFVPGCDAWSVLSGDIAYGVRQGTLYAHDLANAHKTTYKKKSGEIVLEPAKWAAPELWKLETSQAKAKPSTRSIIRAGSRLYCHTGTVLVAVDLPAAQGACPTIAWEQPLPGTPGTMLAGDDKLFVVTLEGQVFCFGAAPGEPTVHALPDKPLVNGRDDWSRRAAAILRESGQTDGYCVVLGLENGRLVEELLRQSTLRVVAVDPDLARVNTLRGRLADGRLYGTRAEVFVGDPVSFDLPPYMASLIVSERHTLADLAAGIPAARFVRLLRPYGGTACLAAPAAEQDRVASWFETNDLASARLTSTDEFSLIRSEGPLPGSALWTHECASAARTYFSEDKLVNPPLGVLWYGDSAEVGFKKHKDYHVGVKPQVTNGVLVAFDEREKQLSAYDVYTGRRLWNRDTPAFTRFASLPDGIYVAGGSACVVRDPVTGKELKRFPYPPRRGRRGEPSPVRCRYSRGRRGHRGGCRPEEVEKSGQRTLRQQGADRAGPRNRRTALDAACQGPVQPPCPGHGWRTAVLHRFAIDHDARRDEAPRQRTGNARVDRARRGPSNGGGQVGEGVREPVSFVRTHLVRRRQRSVRRRCAVLLGGVRCAHRLQGPAVPRPQCRDR